MSPICFPAMTLTGSKESCDVWKRYTAHISNSVHCQVTGHSRARIHDTKGIPSSSSKGGSRKVMFQNVSNFKPNSSRLRRGGWRRGAGGSGWGWGWGRARAGALAGAYSEPSGHEIRQSDLAFCCSLCMLRSSIVQASWVPRRSKTLNACTCR